MQIGLSLISNLFVSICKSVGRTFCNLSQNGYHIFDGGGCRCPVTWQNGTKTGRRVEQPAHPNSRVCSCRHLTCGQHCAKIVTRHSSQPTATIITDQPTQNTTTMER